MLDTLDKVLNVFVDDKYKICEKDGYNEEFKEVLKDGFKKKIIEEVEYEYIEEFKKKAQDELQEQAFKEKIKQLKSLMWAGFFVAFMVGLAVNQATDLIGIFKGTVSISGKGTIFVTIIILSALIIACLLIYGLEYLIKIINAYKKLKEDQK